MTFENCKHPTGATDCSGGGSWQTIASASAGEPTPPVYENTDLSGGDTGGTHENWGKAMGLGNMVA